MTKLNGIHRIRSFELCKAYIRYFNFAAPTADRKSFVVTEPRWRFGNAVRVAVQGNINNYRESRIELRVHSL